tara:strand:+ start:1545 stop:2543 length:999 start_codon:yes stop_codon:yes gene_type:complete
VNNKNFENSLKRISQTVPPIWFMRQAGRYHSHYQNLKKKYSFEQLCKTPELAAEVAYGPVKEFDFDVAILFSDILFILEGLGLGLKFNPGPIFSQYITKDNFKNFSDLDKAFNHLNFQADALKLTREMLPKSKSLIGFVGGPWTLLRFATGKTKEKLQYEDFHMEYMKNVILPLLEMNIGLQLKSGAEIVMIFDSSLYDLDSVIFSNQYIGLIKDLTNKFPEKIGYYSRGRNIKELIPFMDFPLAGMGFDKNISLNDVFLNSNSGFVQGNFDENLMLLSENDFLIELKKFIQEIKAIDNYNGWVCGLGHGINKNTPEKNVHLFIETIRNKFK